MISDMKHDDTLTTETVVHSFMMGDVEDPDLFAAEPLYQWEKSQKGQWIMNNTSPTPSWYRVPEFHGWKYEVRAYLTPHQLTFYKLKYE